MERKGWEGERFTDCKRGKAEKGRKGRAGLREREREVRVSVCVGVNET